MKAFLATISVILLSYPVPKGKYLGRWNASHIWLDFKKDSCYITIVGGLVEKWSAKYISQDSIIKIIDPNKDPHYGDRYIVQQDSIYCSLVPCRMLLKRKTLTALSVYDTLGRNEIQLKQSRKIHFEKRG